MKTMNEAIEHWPIWKLSGVQAYLILISIWFVLGWVIGPRSNMAYDLSIYVSFFGPTALFCFIFARHWFLRAKSPVREGLARRIGCIIAGGITTWFAVETALSYAHMNDAPRGLVWDLNIVIAPVVGSGVLMFIKTVVPKSSIFRNEQ